MASDFVTNKEEALRRFLKRKELLQRKHEMATPDSSEATSGTLVHSVVEPQKAKGAGTQGSGMHSRAEQDDALQPAGIDGCVTNKDAALQRFLARKERAAAAAAAGGAAGPAAAARAGMPVDTPQTAKKAKLPALGEESLKPTASEDGFVTNKDEALRRFHARQAAMAARQTCS